MSWTGFFIGLAIGATSGVLLSNLISYRQRKKYMQLKADKAMLEKYYAELIQHLATGIDTIENTQKAYKHLHRQLMTQSIYSPTRETEYEYKENKSKIVQAPRDYVKASSKS